MIRGTRRLSTHLVGPALRCLGASISSSDRVLGVRMERVWMGKNALHILELLCFPCDSFTSEREEHPWGWARDT